MFKKSGHNSVAEMSDSVMWQIQANPHDAEFSKRDSLEVNLSLHDNHYRVQSIMIFKLTKQEAMHVIVELANAVGFELPVFNQCKGNGQCQECHQA